MGRNRRAPTSSTMPRSTIPNSMVSVRNVPAVSVTQQKADLADGRQRGVQRFDAAGVDGTHPLDDREERIELREHGGLLGRLQLQPRQVGDAAYVFGGQSHGNFGPLRGCGGS